MSVRNQDAEYRAFLGLLRRRDGMNLTKLAKLCGIGRCSLNLVLLGRRSGKPTWRKLEHRLTAAEMAVIRPYAEKKHREFLESGHVHASTLIGPRNPSSEGVPA